MAVLVKNGVAKMKSVTPKKDVQKKLANEAVGKKKRQLLQYQNQ
jgi:hypothetical protein